jgi:hypothetical protein
MDSSNFADNVAASYGTNHPTSAIYDSAFVVDNPTKAGYTFVGWFTAFDGGKCVTNAEGGYKSDAFHLYDVGVKPEDDTYRIILYARYERAKYDVRIIETLDGSQSNIQTVKVTHGDSLWDTAYKVIDQMKNSDSSSYKFIGYSLISTPDIDNPEDMLASNELQNILVDEPMSIYIIKRTAVTITFDYGVSGRTNFEYHGYHGQRLEFNKVYDERNGGYITEIVKNPEFNKGYEFNGWSRTTSNQDMEYTSIEIVKNGNKTYHARWIEQTYTIEYYEGGYKYRFSDGVLDEYTKYTYRNGLNTLFNPEQNAGGYAFVGSSLNADLSGPLNTSINPKTLSGNLKL